MTDEIVVVDEKAVADATAEIAAEETATAEAVTDAIAETAIEAVEVSEATAHALESHQTEDNAKWRDLVIQVENQNQKINQLSESLTTLTNLVQAVAIAETRAASEESPSSTPQAEEIVVENPAQESSHEKDEDAPREAKTETETQGATKRKRIIRRL